MKNNISTTNIKLKTIVPMDNFYKMIDEIYNIKKESIQINTNDNNTQKEFMISNNNTNSNSNLNPNLNPNLNKARPPVFQSKLLIK